MGFEGPAQRWPPAPDWCFQRDLALYQSSGLGSKTYIGLFGAMDACYALFDSCRATLSLQAKAKPASANPAGFVLAGSLVAGSSGCSGLPFA